MIRLQHVEFGYGRSALFDGLDLVLTPGNVYGLLGVNGAGKSTLLRLLTGLLFPRAGTVEALGHEPARRKPGFLSRVFVLPENLNLPGVTDARFLWTRAPLYEGFDRQLFERYADGFDLPRGRRLTTLSHGQQKKFMLAFGLASGASLLVMDEPTNGLDIPSKGQFRRFVAEAVHDDRVIVISTHQVQDVASLIDPVVILHGGRVLFDHPLQRVAERVRMSHTAARPDDGAAGLLYSEPAVGGFRSLWADSASDDGHVDLELLFNMVVSRPDAVREVFGSEGERP